MFCELTEAVNVYKLLGTTHTHTRTNGHTDSFNWKIAILLKIPKFLAEIPDLYAWYIKKKDVSGFLKSSVKTLYYYLQIGHDQHLPNKECDLDIRNFPIMKGRC